MPNLLKRVVPVLILTALGLGVSLAIDVVHQRLLSDAHYTSFCNVSTTVNCDVVLSSPYAKLFGAPLSRWALLFYLAMLGLGLAVASVRGANLRHRLATAIFMGAVWGGVFSFYLAVIALGVLRTLCVMCFALYLVNIGFFVCAWRLRAGLRTAGRYPLAQRRRERAVLFGGLAVAVVLVAVGSWEAFGRSRSGANAAEIERDRPEFYRWFFAQPTVAVTSDSSNARGPDAAPVTIVEFSDFECGHCAKLRASLDAVARRGGDNLRVVFRHFPLDAGCNPKVKGRLHEHACLAAVAAECAGEQRKFWAYHDQLFEHQLQLNRDFFLDRAAELGLDLPQFTQCLGGEAARARVDRDIAIGIALGVESTPTLFLNGRIIKGALEPERLADALVLARSVR